MAMLNPYNYGRPKNFKPLEKKDSKTTKIKNVNSGYNRTDSYLEQKVLSAKPEELTFLLYEGIVKFIKQAKIFNDGKNYEKSSNANMRAQAIIVELRSTLNMDIEISNNLDQIYIFMMDKLVDANVSKDNKTLDEVLGLAEDLRDTWKEAMGL